MSYLDQIRQAESGGDPYARNPRSSATGPDQFVDRTWLEMMASRPDLTEGLSRDQILNLRTDPAISREMTEAYANQNKTLLGNAGLPVNDGTTYLAHFAGPQGAIKVLQADPTAPVGTVLGDNVVRANPFLAKMTAGDLISWAGKKMGVNAPQPAPQMPQQAPQGVLAPQPQQQGGVLAQAPQQAPQGVLAPQAPQPAQQRPQADSGGMASVDIPQMKPVEHLPINIPLTLYQKQKRAMKGRA